MRFFIIIQSALFVVIEVDYLEYHWRWILSIISCLSNTAI